MDACYGAFVGWVDEGSVAPATRLLAELAARGYVLAPVERVNLGEGVVEGE